MIVKIDPRLPNYFKSRPKLTFCVLFDCRYVIFTRESSYAFSAS